MAINVEQCLMQKDNFAVKEGIESVLVRGDVPKFAPKFSIAIPVYKRLDTLKQCLSAALGQKTRYSFDVIVVEDNPETNTDIEKYLAGIDDPRLLYYRNTQNLGLVGNFNRVLEVSDGEIVVTIHDDDILSLDYLEEIGMVMDACPDADIVCPDYYRWREYAGEPFPAPHWLYSASESRIKARLWKPLPIWEPFCRTFAPTGMAIRRSAISKSGGYDYLSGPSTDLYFIVRAGLSGMNYYRYDKKLFVYRWAENESMKPKTRMDFIEAGLPLRRYILSKSWLPKCLSNMLLKDYSARALDDFKKSFPNEHLDSSLLVLPKSEAEHKFASHIKDAFTAALSYRKYFYPKF